MPEMAATPRWKRCATRDQTVNCDEQQHDGCDGYIAPLVYSSTRPCGCPCHDRGNPRDFKRALQSAEESFYA